MAADWIELDSPDVWVRFDSELVRQNCCRCRVSQLSDHFRHLSKSSHMLHISEFRLWFSLLPVIGLTWRTMHALLIRVCLVLVSAHTLIYRFVFQSTFHLFLDLLALMLSTPPTPMHRCCPHKHLLFLILTLTPPGKCGIAFVAYATTTRDYLWVCVPCWLVLRAVDIE